MDQHTLVLGSSTSEIAVWDVTESKRIGQILKHDDSVTSIAVSPENEKILVSSGLDGRLLLTDIRLKQSGDACFEIIDPNGRVPVIKPASVSLLFTFTSVKTCWSLRATRLSRLLLSQQHLAVGSQRRRFEDSSYGRAEKRKEISN